MNARLLVLAERRAMLVARAASQRAELAQALAPLHKTLTGVDRGVSALRNLLHHPVLWAGAGVFALLKPRLAFGWLRSGVMLAFSSLAAKCRLF